MATMKTLNGYGFNATELNGKTSDSYLQLGDDAAGSTGEAPKINADTLGGVDASNYLKKTDTASDTSKLGGKAPEYYIQPRNLLDNSDFRNPVNQRGQTDYTNNGYTIDRWELYSGAVGVSSLGYITTSGQMYQKIAVPTDKVYTFAIENDAGIALVTGIPANGIHSATLGNVLIKLATISGYVEVVIEPSEGHNVAGAYWAALYEGTYTAETLPPYVPKGYAAELVECMRYYYRLQNGTNFIFRIRNQHETNNYAAFDICPCITFPVPMRIVPTVSMYYDITDGTSSVGAPFDCSRTSCTVPDVSIPHGGWFDLDSLIASADL